MAMPNKAQAFLRTTALLGLSLSLALTTACFSDRPLPGSPVVAGNCRVPVGSPAVGSVRAIVGIRQFQFVPQTIRIPRGTTITWINCEESFADEQHTTTSDAREWESPLLSPGDAYEQRFDQPGTYSYHCEPHPFMRATVIVD